MKRFKFVLLASAFSAIALTGCFESESQTSAENTTGASASADASPSQVQTADQTTQNAVAAASSAKQDKSGSEGIYCYETPARQATLVAVEFPMSDQLNFNLNVWDLNSGHSCGVNSATAQKTGQNTWKFTDTNDAKCTLEISYGDGAMNVAQSRDSRCNYLCGARAQIGTIAFDNSTKKSSTVNAETLKEASNGKNLCN